MYVQSVPPYFFRQQHTRLFYTGVITTFCGDVTGLAFPGRVAENGHRMEGQTGACLQGVAGLRDIGGANRWHVRARLACLLAASRTLVGGLAWRTLGVAFFLHHAPRPHKKLCRAWEKCVLPSSRLCGSFMCFACVFGFWSFPFLCVVHFPLLRLCRPHFPCLLFPSPLALRAPSSGVLCSSLSTLAPPPYFVSVCCSSAVALCQRLQLPSSSSSSFFV